MSIGHLASVLRYLESVVPKKFTWTSLAISERVGVSSLVVRPIRRDSASLRVTDTGVSIYLEILGAKWEADASDLVRRSGGEMPDFADQLRVVNDVASAAALYGVVRVRATRKFWGAETHVLKGQTDGDAWAARRDLVVVRRWRPW